jgi:hypothetical protein
VRRLAADLQLMLPRRAETMTASRSRARRLWLVALAICLAPACGDEVVHVSLSRADAGSLAADAGASAVDAGASAVDAALPVADAGSSNADAGSSAADTSASAMDVGEMDAGSESQGAEQVCVNAPSGMKVLDVPADCHATICDGAGHAAGVVVAQSNVPVPAAPCLFGTCDALGRAATAPLPAGAACRVGPGGAVCDGAGRCVECNHVWDCAPGLYCDVNHHCGAAPCTDLDCGGACAPCDLDKRCRVDEDCQSFACDAASARCIQNQCLDHAQDGNETDLDCGGGICKGCELGQACFLDLDCKSQACDAISSKCISDGCADHRTDGAETDVDCGGGACPACEVGKKCNFTFDCPPGHVCGVMKVCQ